MENKELKICKYCASQIPIKASVCPKCQKDLRNWFVRHWIITTILVLFVIWQLSYISTESLMEYENIKSEIEEKYSKADSMLNTDGSNIVLTNMIKDMMNNPNSYSHINTKYELDWENYVFTTKYYDNWEEKVITAKFDENNNFIDFIN